VGKVALGTSWRRDLVGTVRWLSAGALGGLIAGLVAGGVGGRFAMLVLRLTSDPALRGLETDDGFIIGRFSGETLFLLIFTAFFGLLGGLFYLVVRSLVPPRQRPGLTGVFGGIVGGAIVISPGGIDFTLLEPLGLAVAMFIALPAVYGVAVSLVVERFLARDSAFARSRAWIAGLVLLLPLGFFGVVGLGVLALILAVVLLGRAAPEIASLWTSPPVAWIGRAGLVTIAILWGAALIRDVAEIL